MGECDPKDYLKKIEHDDKCNDKWERDDDWKKERTRKDDDRWDKLVDQIQSITLQLAILTNSFNLVKKIVFGAVALIGTSFMMALFYLVGWRH